ncbi:phospholipase D-like domain-containing protein [Capnocytophaga canis]|uniref:PLD phosphodiesterase domain-containing protein n=1 Tax=Capnocytophaga canis TaxID=1848903 RepID=A0A3A1YE15_9FLAO|nr:phospholipase D-like domain-containing protein [Capnocytophaga canis]RIY35905.1 hypothetical protein CKY20_08560 [Capnocytophaga canis]
MKLIYHKTDSFEEYSIFDVELVTLAYQQNLCLISPYIGINYLERLIQLSKSWRLITDFEEWIISYTSKDQRNKIVEFITKNSDKIKHISDIHAKVLISEHSAFLGSANFTDKGICQRTEMSVSFSEQEKVQEIKSWFESLWEKAINFTEQQLYDFVKKNENTNPKPRIKKLKSPSKKIMKRASLVDIGTFFKTDKDYQSELIKAIKKIGKDKIWLNRFFDLIKELLTDLEIEEQSPKITMSVTKDFRMPISIGQRYVIWAKSQRNKVGLILPLEFRDLISGYPAAEIDEDYFYNKKKNKEALWVNFGNDVIFYDDHFLFEQWKKAAKVELDRTNYSGYRRAHNPLYYRLVMDLEYRKKILDLCD